VSANVAPATSTRLGDEQPRARRGVRRRRTFGVEVFPPATSRVLMAALLVHDLRTGGVETAHPDDVFAAQAAHGGLWRLGYDLRSVIGIAAVRGLPAALRR
jgi:predicted nucleic acid-binding protein